MVLRGGGEMIMSPTESWQDSQDAETVNRSHDHSVGSPVPQFLHQHQIKYDIFINHRGPDTKLKFVTHLQEALTEKQYTPFVDKSVEEGRHAFEEIKSAIQGTLVHLAIFSPGYAESEYCLDELVDMLDCSKKNPSAVTLVPIFYDVKPQDLRRPDSVGNPFREAFQRHAQRGRYSDERISGWKKALQDAAAVKGFELIKFAGDTNELKKEIVRRVQEIIVPRSGLNRRQPVPRLNVGRKVLLAGTLRQLKEMGDNVAILGICGMGGIGKTTLAQEVYNHYSSKRDFLYQTFLKIGESKDMSHLRKQALRELLNKKEKNLVERYANLFEQLAGRKVLIVIDDISSAAHFKELVPNMKTLGAGSRIILTSRQRDTLRAAMIEAPLASYLHEMKQLNAADSFELFWFHAFQNKELPKEDDVFRPLALKVVELCGGLPLALELMGQHLFEKTEKVWTDATKSMRDRPGIIDVLSISYNRLDNPSDRMMFLDIACQMDGLLEEDAIDIWKSCEHCRFGHCMTSKMVHDSLQILKDKSLVEVDKDKRLTMHVLLREMGRKMDVDDDKIGRKKKGHPCHLWIPVDANEVLNELEETKEIRGLSLVGQQSSYDTSAFQKMSEIHLLQLDGACIEGNFSQLSKRIRWLQWRSLYLADLPSQLQVQNLIILDLSNSSSLTRLWSDGDTQVPKQLRVLHLQNCTALEEIPETIKLLTMLRTLNLKGCKSLTVLPRSLGELQSLQDLNLTMCKSLKALPHSIGKLLLLEELNLTVCNSLKELPHSIGKLLSRQELNLTVCNSLKEPPHSIGKLLSRQELNFTVRNSLKVPHSIGKLQSLLELNLVGCNAPIELPSWMFPQIVESLKRGRAKGNLKFS